MGAIPFPTVIETERLVLRPFEDADVPTVLAIQSNWNVARNLRFADWPPTIETVRSFLDSHPVDWRAGTAYRFAVLRDGRVIGCCDLGGVRGEVCDIGYWYEEPSWGHGFATEAAMALIDLAVRRLGIRRLVSGHAADNPGSGRVLVKLGFHRTAVSTTWSKPRQTEIEHWRYAQDLPARG
jgi:ribosomal-protein-alanine N-acetyltransferase